MFDSVEVYCDGEVSVWDLLRVVARLEDDPSLTGRRREVALQIVLREAVARQAGSARRSGGRERAPPREPATWPRE